MSNQRSVLPRVFQVALIVSVIGWMANAATEMDFEGTPVAETKLKSCYVCAYTSHSSGFDLDTGTIECSEFTNGKNIRRVDCAYDCFIKTYAKDGVTYVERGCSRGACENGEVVVKPLTMHQSCCGTDMCNGASQLWSVSFARCATIACVLLASVFASCLSS